MKNGIICLETEWEHTVKGNRLRLQTKSLLDFIENAWDCKIIYRRVATISEFQYYLKRFKNKEYDEYSIFYLSFHGDTHSIVFEGEDKKENTITLSQLTEMANGLFTNRYVHFSSCRTLLGSERELQDFKKNSGALYVSGYTKTIDSIMSAINDMSYFDQIFRHQKKKALVMKSMDKYYKGLDDSLGFKII